MVCTERELIILQRKERRQVSVDFPPKVYAITEMHLENRWVSLFLKDAPLNLQKKKQTFMHLRFEFMYLT